MRPTNALEKLAPSILNALITFLVSLPFGFWLDFDLKWRLIWLAIFYVYCLTCQFTLGRDLGMILMGSIYNKKYTLQQRLTYETLYTISFSTILISILWPFDLLLLNLLFIQLPTVLLTGTTLHGYLSGGVETVKSHRT